ncbi:hypothetical protein D0Z00_001323 [Geotrichum galactomycetum]|uniref:Uncharacterized protein n=1 Tax=Geotrichum galactomycetum TaxID=27317 RepID=A0ACB6V7C4_9ASCO|nr:hypothetical protein D0Z00_001323 [Geotrichum candidum]
MSIPYATIQKINTSFNKDFVKNPVGVFVGGTSGIGEHTAYEFAKLTVNPTIYIVGRSEESGARVQDKIKKLNSNATVHFLKHDLKYIEQAERVANIIRNKEDKVNVLSLSQGSLLNQPRTETSEGLDEKFALLYYGRWTIVKMLVPLLQKAADQGGPARVLSVLSAGNERSVDFDDLELKKNYTFLHSNLTAASYNSLAVLRFARKYPNISFCHTFPGFVRTQVFREFPLWQRFFVAGVAYLFAKSPEVCAEHQIYVALTGPEFATGGHLLGENLQSTQTDKPPYSEFALEENQDKLWEHTEAMINRANENDIIES